MVQGNRACIRSVLEVQHENVVRSFHEVLGREDILKQTIGNYRLHVIFNDNEVIVINFATSENSTVKNTVFQHRNIH
jgi:hypothetical protein